MKYGGDSGSEVRPVSAFNFFMFNLASNIIRKCSCQAGGWGGAVRQYGGTFGERESACENVYFKKIVS